MYSGEKMMEKRVCILLVVMALCVLSKGEKGKDGEINESEIDRKLRSLNKPAIKTIMSEDGDIIDCVDIYKQPAFDHPALKDHILQVKPSFKITEDISSTKPKSSRAVTSQIWKRSGSCPNGTVPIRRIRREDLLRAESLDRFGRKPPSNSERERRMASKGHVGSFNTTQTVYLPTPPNRSDAILQAYGDNYIGASASINTQNPRVDHPGDYSSAQMWLKNMAVSGFESVEVGWQVNPGVYGDGETRLFAHWTDDGYQSTGCFDLICPGFVQTNIHVVLGGVITPLSIWGRTQYDLANVSIRLDTETGNWWLIMGDFGNVGYWPSSLFAYGMQQNAIIVEWGGEVYSLDVKKRPHTDTFMGGGIDLDPKSLFGHACYIKDPMIVDYSLVPKYPTPFSIWIDEPNCYTAINQREVQPPLFYFGGPGESRICP